MLPRIAATSRHSENLSSPGKQYDGARWETSNLGPIDLTEGFVRDRIFVTSFYNPVCFVFIMLLTHPRRAFAFQQQYSEIAVVTFADACHLRMVISMSNLQSDILGDPYEALDFYYNRLEDKPKRLPIEPDVMNACVVCAGEAGIKIPNSPLVAASSSLMVLDRGEIVSRSNYPVFSFGFRIAHKVRMYISPVTYFLHRNSTYPYVCLVGALKHQSWH